MVKRRKKAPTQLGPKIRHLREEMGLTPQDLARQTGLSVEVITKVEALDK